jgi:LPS export ABC transporter protein LptC
MFFFVVLLILSFFGCRAEKKEIIDAITDRAKTPMMHVDSVTTIVSDSGITRYRISAAVWEVYDRVQEPYWEFPQGVHFERFDLDLNVDANIQSQYAKFLQNQQLWELRHKVRATNIEGTLFVTEQLFWNQRTEKIYSDSLITITEPDGRIIIGENGFEANQQLTKYMIKNSSGKIPVAE